MTKELLDRYLKEAYRMGQVFWQQADSEFVSQHKKADVTKAKFDQLLIDAGEALAQQEHLPDSEYARGFADGQKEFAEIAGGAWQTAVIDQLVVHHIYQAIHDKDPRKAVHDLLCISNDIALDPQVSSDAQALIDRGRMEAQQEQPASVDAYVGAREDAAIWKKRALEAEELNRKFIAELNGPTYLGEPVKQEQPAQEPVAWDGKLPDTLTKALASVYNYANHDAAGDLAYQVRQAFESICTTNATLKRMFAACQKRCEELEAAPTQPAQEPVSTEDMASAYLEKHLWKVIDMAGMWPKAKIDTRTWQHAMVYAPTQPALSDEELKALLRFSETCEDGEGYDVPKPMMQRLAVIGVVRRVTGNIYEATEIGERFIEAHCRGGVGK